MYHIYHVVLVVLSSHLFRSSESASETHEQGLRYSQLENGFEFMSAYYVHHHKFCPVWYGDKDVVRNSSIGIDHNITFKSLKYRQDYKLAAFTACDDDTGLDAIMAMARDVITSSNKVDLDTLSKMVNSSSRVEMVKKIALSQAPVLCVTAVGVLAALILPIVNYCFCCCRCCGRCGGKLNLIDARKHSKKCCLTTGVFLFLITTVLTFGMGGIYIMGLRMLQTPDYLTHVANFTVDDVLVYKDEIFDQLEQVAKDDLQFVVGEVSTMVANSGVHISSHFMTSEYNKISALLSDLDTISSSSALAAIEIAELEALIAVIHSNYTVLDTELTDTRAKVELRFDQCGTSTVPAADCPSLPDENDVPSPYDFTQTPDLTNQKTYLTHVENADILTIKNETNTEYEKIPERIANSSAPTLTIVDETLTNISNIIQPQLDDLHLQIDNASESIQDLRQSIEDMNQMSQNVISYGNYAIMGLSGIVFLIIIFTLLGLLHGISGIKAVEKPTQRTVFGHCGRNCIMVSVYFSFLFATLFFMLGSILFFIGAQLTLFCEPIQNLDILELMDDRLSVDGDHYLGKAFLGNGSIPLTIFSVIKGCKANEAVYHTLKLSELLDVTTIVDIDAQMPNMTAIYQAVQADMAGVTIIPASAISAMQALNNTVAYPMDVGAMTSGLQGGVTALRPMLTTIASKLQAAADLVQSASAPYHAEYIAELGDIQALINETLPNLETSVAMLYTKVVSLQGYLGGILDSTDSAINNMADLNAFVPGIGADLINLGIDDFISHVISYASQYVTHLEKRLSKDVGRCHVVYDIYEGITYSVCSFFLDPFNGFWMSLSIVAVFLLANIIFGVRLAKYLSKLVKVRKGLTRFKRGRLKTEKRRGSRPSSVRRVVPVS